MPRRTGMDGLQNSAKPTVTGDTPSVVAKQIESDEARIEKARSRAAAKKRAREEAARGQFGLKKRDYERLYGWWDRAKMVPFRCKCGVDVLDVLWNERKYSWEWYNKKDRTPHNCGYHQARKCKAACPPKPVVKTKRHGSKRGHGAVRP
jgi:hypothetical protein